MKIVIGVNNHSFGKMFLIFGTYGGCVNNITDIRFTFVLSINLNLFFHGGSYVSDRVNNCVL